MFESCKFVDCCPLFLSNWSLGHKVLSDACILNCASYFRIKQFQSFGSYVKVLEPCGISLGGRVRDKDIVSVFYKLKISFPSPFAKDSVFSPMCVFDIFVKKKKKKSDSCHCVDFYMGAVVYSIDLCVYWVFLANVTEFLLLQCCYITWNPV